MKKLLLVLFSAVFLFGCSSSDGDSGSSSSYSPPTWIQGTWGFKADGISYTNDQPLYKFTSDNFCLFVGGITQCWKEAIRLTPQVMSGSDSHTDSTYEINLISGNGATTLTMNFKKVSATKIMWVTSTGDVELDKLK